MSYVAEHLHGNQIAADRIWGEFKVDLNLFSWIENGLVYFFEEKLNLWITESHHSRPKLFLSELGALHDLLARDLSILVEKAKYRGLEYICDYLILLLCIKKCNLDLTISVKPRQCPILIFLFEPHVKSIGACFELRWDIAIWLVHLRPGAVCENLTLELHALNFVSITQMPFELCLHFLTEFDIFEHLCHLIYLVSATLYF